MKKTLLFVCLSLTILTSRAQFQSGQKLIGGQVSLNLSNATNTATPGVPASPDQRASNAYVNFSLSKFKSPTVLNGAGISYGYANTRSGIGSSAERKVTVHSIGAFVNKTKLQPLAKGLYLSFTGAASGIYQFGNSEGVNTTTKEKTKGYALGVAGSMGLMYQVSRRFLISGDLINLLSLTYSHGSQEVSNTPGSTKSTNNSFSFNSGLGSFSLNNIAFGVKYLL